MKKSTLTVLSFLSIFIGIAFSGTLVYAAEYHHVQSCMVCHDMHGGANLSLIAEQIDTPNSSPPLWNVIFLYRTGTNSFADGDFTYDGVCEVCHTQTRHHLNDGSDKTEHFEGQDCTSCHSHCNEFSAPGAQSHDTHLTFDKGPKIDCTDCHNPSDYSLFVDDNPLDTTNACDTCHSPGGAFDGVGAYDPDDLDFEASYPDSVAFGAKYNWAGGIYETDGVTLKADKEQWCATCHDDVSAYSRPSIPGAPPEPIIVDDDDDPEFTGTWPTSTPVTAYGGSTRYHPASDGSSKVRWTPDLPAAGSYKVYAWWHSYSNRVTDAEYTIVYNGGPDVVEKNQEINGGVWNLLGTYSFAAGTSGYVELSDDSDDPADQYIMADAVKFELIDASMVIVDNPEATTVGNWGTSTPATAYGGNTLYGTPGDGSNTVTWTAPPVLDGEYNVYAWWHSYSNRVTDAEYTIHYNGGTDVVEMNQEVNGGQWNLLGTYPLASGTSGYVVLSDASDDPADQYIFADAIMWLSTSSLEGVYAPNVIGDHGTYGFYDTGHKINCLNCHDASMDHIDHEHRTYSAAGNNYREGYRLGAPMRVPLPWVANGPVSSIHARLCFDCHNPYEVLGTDIYDTSHTNFQEGDDSNRNLHWYHFGIGNAASDSDFDGVLDSAFTCIICHNVHGSPNSAMIRHGELISTPGTTDKVPALNFTYIVPPATEDPYADIVDTVAADLQWGTGSFAYNYLCADCHSSQYYERSPNLVPKVLDSQTAPKTVSAGAPTEVVFSVRVLDPDDDIVSVTIDLSDVGLSSGQGMYDDGQAATSGDAVAGDNIYSAKDTVNVAYGLYELMVTATDPANNMSEGAVTLEVTDTGVIVIDNPEATTVGNWGTSTPVTAYGGNTLWGWAGDGSNTVRWTPDLVQAGTYKVSAWWHAYSNRVTDAEYTIVYNGGTDVVEKNQEITGGQWVSLGFYPFAAGTSGYVELSDDSDDPADQLIMADAVKFELVDVSEVILDNPEATTVGIWGISAPPTAYGGSSMYRLAGAGSNTVTWTAPPVLDGEYKVYAWWHAHSNRVTDAEYTIHYNGGTDVVEKNQRINGGQWNQLGTGTYSFVSGTPGYVVLSDASDDPADQFVMADAVRFERQGP